MDIWVLKVWDNIGELKIYGVIGDWWDGNTSTDFLHAFKELEAKFDIIHIHINSPGGSVHEGLPIVNAIKASSKDVHTYVDGIAFSMGAMIAIAAKKKNAHMAKGSLLMLHSVSTYIYGNAQALRDEADVLDKYDDTLGSVIATRTGKNMEAVRSDYMNHKDNYFTPDEALAEGLIDSIEDYEAEETPANVRAMTQTQIAAWYNERMQEPSETLMQKITGRVKAALGVNNNSNDMFGNKFSKLGALAKLAAASITAQQVDDVNAQIVENGIEGVTLVLDSELEEKVNLVTTLQTDKSALETKVSGL
uniref:ATP-dependent Clp protease proteolytic subunit n=1 Tax=Panagrolaimus sp. ES5 TaxID=591445 RepID=A0AC34GEI6_9BILA